MRSVFLCLSLLLSACLPSEVVNVQKVPLDDGMLLLEGGGGNTVIVPRGQTVLVFDTKMWPFDHDVERAVNDTHALRILIANSHVHVDHTGGNDLFPDALVFSAPDVAEELRHRHSIPVRDELRILVGTEPAVLVHPAAAHTSGDLFAWFPRTHLLITGDLFDHGYYPHIDPHHGGTYLGLLAALEKLAEYPASVVIPGHGPKATLDDLIAARDFLRTIRDDVRRERTSGASDDAIVAKLEKPSGEKLENLGGFSSRRQVVQGFVAEIH